MVDDARDEVDSKAGFAAPVAPAQESRPLQAGQLVDGYRLDRHLHQGHAAQLWLVSATEGIDQHRRTEPEALVMKVARPTNGNATPDIVALEVEQLVLPHLASAHAPRFVAKGDVGGQPYVVMTHIAGTSLAERIAAAPLPIVDIIDIGTRLATALHDLHRQHLIHHDIQPANVIFRERGHPAPGQAVLIGLGRARHDHLPDLRENDASLPSAGTAHVSPEETRRVRSEPRSDVFALGALLYQLTTGAPPFGSPADEPALRDRPLREPTPPIALRSDCPPWLQEIILQALEPQPERRQPSAAQLAFDLQHPDQLALTDRAARRSRGGKMKVLGRWLSAISGDASVPEPDGAARQLARSPLLLVAIDFDGTDRELLDAMRLTAGRLLQIEPDARLACLAVMPLQTNGSDAAPEAGGSGRHVNLQMQLKHWARPLIQSLRLPPEASSGRVSYHVLEAPDAADAITDHAQKNQVDHIVMAARNSSKAGAKLGSVATQVIATSNCSVTVVRTPLSAKD